MIRPLHDCTYLKSAMDAFWTFVSYTIIVYVAINYCFDKVSFSNSFTTDRAIVCL